jgi:hypothetical protein
MKAPAGIVILVVALTVMGARAQPAPHDTYPDLQDTPPRSETPAMTVDEIAKLKQDLSAARDRQQQPVSPTPAARTTAKGTTAKIKRDH